MDEVVAEFVTEISESLAMLDLDLVTLEKEPQNTAILGKIFRVIHTIKGTCGFLNLSRLEKVAHAGEDILGKFRDGELEVTPEAITLILQALDCIKGIIEAIMASGAEPAGDDGALIASLQRFAEGGHSEPAAEAEADYSHFFAGDDDLAALIEAERVKSGKPPAEAAPPAPPPVMAEEKAPPAATGGEQPSGTASIRVNLEVLEKMMQMVGELVLSRNQLMQLARSSAGQEFVTPIQQLGRITTELQESVMKTRMQPIGSAWNKFPRLVRDLSQELGKKIELRMIGEETELDRQLLEAVKDPLTHMVRNSCDHGIETPEARTQSGKPPSGTVTLNAYHDGGHIVIDISDDGKGLDVERIKEKVLANGLASATDLAGMSQRQLLQYIFEPGFSTAKEVTAVSGRGVGMDVVRTNIEKIGGTIDLSSTPGQGSKVSIKIPLTLAIVSVLIVETAAQRFAIPQINVKELIQLGEQMPIKVERINDALVIRLRETLLPVVSLAGVLKLEEALAGGPEFVVVCNVGGNEFGIMVDRIHNIEEIVVKPVSQAIKSVPLFSGNTILGDGSVIMILDPASLAREVGDIKLSDHRADKAGDAAAGKNADQMMSFLLFRYGGATPHAVPLELVWRLEEIEAGRVEWAGRQPVVQYRGELMRLTSLEQDFILPTEGKIPIIVFTYDGQMIGLPVGQIIDIVDAPFDLQLSSSDKGYLGSMVIAGRTTDVVDVAHLLGKMQAEEGASPMRNSGHILLVDDSPFFLKMTAPFLTSAGYKVTTAENGIAALAQLDRPGERFDLIVTDINMPEMDGFGLARACEASPRAAIPIIGCTATPDQDILKKARESGMVTCVFKNNRAALLEAMAAHQWAAA